MTLRNRDELIIGGIYIPPEGGVNIYDWYTEADTTQDLVSQAFQATATLYIPLHPQIRAFMFYGYYIGYVDSSVNVNDLGEIYFFDRIAADDWENQMGCFYAKATTTNETPLTAVGSRVTNTPPYPVFLETSGRVYFKTVWDTAVINCNAVTEHFFLILYGKAIEHP